MLLEFININHELVNSQYNTNNAKNIIRTVLKNK